MEEPKTSSNEERKWGPLPASPYEALGVSLGATDQEIAQAYKKVAIKYHPDSNPDNKKEATQWIQIINEARSLFLDKNFKATHFKKFQSPVSSTYRQQQREREDAQKAEQQQRESAKRESKTKETRREKGLQRAEQQQRERAGDTPKSDKQPHAPTEEPINPKQKKHVPLWDRLSSRAKNILRIGAAIAVTGSGVYTAKKVGWLESNPPAEQGNEQKTNAPARETNTFTAPAETTGTNMIARGGELRKENQERIEFNEQLDRIKSALETTSPATTPETPSRSAFSTNEIKIALAPSVPSPTVTPSPEPEAVPGPGDFIPTSTTEEAVVPAPKPAVSASIESGSGRARPGYTPPSAPSKSREQIRQEENEKIVAKVEKGEMLTGPEFRKYNEEILPRLRAEERAQKIALRTETEEAVQKAKREAVRREAERKAEATRAQTPQPPGAEWVTVPPEAKPAQFTPAGATADQWVKAPTSEPAYFTPPGTTTWNVVGPETRVKSMNMSGEIKNVHERNLKKIFPSKTLKSWEKINDKNAHELIEKMSKDRNLNKSDQLLLSYLLRLQEVTGKEPLLSETLEEFIARALRDAESKNLLTQLE